MSAVRGRRGTTCSRSRESQSATSTKVRARVKGRLKDDHLAAGGQSMRKEVAREEAASSREGSAKATKASAT